MDFPIFAWHLHESIGLETPDTMGPVRYRLVDRCYIHTKHSTQHPGPTFFVHLFEEALFYNWSFFALFVSNARRNGRKILGHLLSSHHTPNKAFSDNCSDNMRKYLKQQTSHPIHWMHTLMFSCLVAMSKTCPTIAVFCSHILIKPSQYFLRLWWFGPH